MAGADCGWLQSHTGGTGEETFDLSGDVPADADFVLIELVAEASSGGSIAGWVYQAGANWSTGYRYHAEANTKRYFTMLVPITPNYSRMTIMLQTGTVYVTQIGFRIMGWQTAGA